MFISVNVGTGSVVMRSRGKWNRKNSMFNVRSMFSFEYLCLPGIGTCSVLIVVSSIYIFDRRDLPSLLLLTPRRGPSSGSLYLTSTNNS
jgi:hypothetical protein